MGSIPDFLRFRETRFHPEIQKVVTSCFHYIKMIKRVVPKLETDFASRIINSVSAKPIAEDNPDYAPDYDAMGDDGPLNPKANFVLAWSGLNNLFENYTGKHNARLLDIFKKFQQHSNDLQIKDIIPILDSLLEDLDTFLNGVAKLD